MSLNATLNDGTRCATDARDLGLILGLVLGITLMFFIAIMGFCCAAAQMYLLDKLYFMESEECRTKYIIEQRKKIGWDQVGWWLVGSRTIHGPRTILYHEPKETSVVEQECTTRSFSVKV